MSIRQAAAAFLAALGCGVLLLSLDGWAYDQYSVNKDLTNCAACHGDFRASPYNEGITRDPNCPPTCDPNTEWPSSLMDTHVDYMVNGECLACHSSGSRFPVLTGSSKGNSGNLIYSCAGCHGRAGDADPNGSGADGFDAGLRQHHRQAGVTVCATCHVDADPALYTPVGEDILPPNYASPGAGAPDVPGNPCNSDPNSPESKVGASRGLDNDGDGFYDEDDTDCGATASTPGEVTDLRITAHDPNTQTLSLSYASGCASTGNKLVYGALLDVGIYGYAGEACDIGDTGSYDWTYPSDPNAVFILIIGDDGTAEGSYGTDSNGTERPKKLGGCWLPQDISRRCDT
jgi:hypothetical protein